MKFKLQATWPSRWPEKMKRKPKNRKDKNNPFKIATNLLDSPKRLLRNGFRNMTWTVQIRGEVLLQLWERFTEKLPLLNLSAHMNEGREAGDSSGCKLFITQALNIVWFWFCLHSEKTSE